MKLGKVLVTEGERLLKKTFIFALIPNLLLMFLTVLEIIPHFWFEPLLTKTFIIACIIFTIILYPVTLDWLSVGKEGFDISVFFAYIPSKTMYIEYL